MKTRKGWLSCHLVKLQTYCKMMEVHDINLLHMLKVYRNKFSLDYLHVFSEAQQWKSLIIDFIIKIILCIEKK